MLSYERGNWAYCRKAKILTREMLGSETLYKIQILNPDSGENMLTIMSKSLDMGYAVDEEIYVGIEEENLYYFDNAQMRIRDESLLTGCLQLTKEGELND